MFRLHWLLSVVVVLAIGSEPAGAQDAFRGGEPRGTLPATRAFDAASDASTAQRSPASRSTERLRSSVPQPSGQPTATAARVNIAQVLATAGLIEPADLSASGRYLVATAPPGTLVIYDATSGRRIRVLEDSDSKYALVKMSPDVRWIAAARNDDPRLIDVWRADNGRLIRTIVSAATPKQSLEFTPTGDALRVVDQNGQGIVYSVPGGVVTGGFSSANGAAMQNGPAAQIAPSLTPQAGAAAAPSIAASPNPGARSTMPAPQFKPPAEPAAAAPDDARFEPSVAAPQAAQTQAPALSERPMARSATPPAAPAPVAAPQAAAPRAALPQASASAEPPIAAPQAAMPQAAAPRVAAPAEPIVAPQAAAIAEPAAAPQAAHDIVEESISTATGAAARAPQSFAFEAASEPTAESDSTAAAQALNAAATEPAPEDLSSVTVHYATNRNRLSAAEREWSTYFKNFFGSLPAFVVYIVVLLAVLVFPWMGKRSWAAAALVCGAVVLGAMGTLEAYVRSQLRDELTGEVFGARASDISYGTCKVSVPRPENRQAGELNRPLSVWILEAPSNPEKHFTLQGLEEYADKDEFYRSLSSQLAKSSDGVSLLFIHGYNVSFEDAIFRTAQLAVDLKFPGAPITFSWPSCADPLKYTFDEQNAEVSIPALREVLEDLATRSGAKRIHIIAHSMGNRVLAGALRSMPPEARPVNKQMFREVVLAAPDIDSRVFKTQILPHIQENAHHCTLYASNRDRALLMSRYFHNYQRLGETEPELIVASGMDTIDASLVDTSLLGHSYIGDVQSIVTDLRDLVVRGMRPVDRGGLESLLLGGMMYWTIKPLSQAATDQESTRR